MEDIRLYVREDFSGLPELLRDEKEVFLVHDRNVSWAAERIGALCALRGALALDASEAAKPFREGFELVRRTFLNAVAKFGLKPVEGVVGKPLDTATSEAITIMRTGQTAPGCVVYETRKGYSLNGKVLRAAQVVVEDEAEEPAPEAEKPAEEPAPAEPAGHQEA